MHVDHLPSKGMVILQQAMLDQQSVVGCISDDRTTMVGWLYRNSAGSKPPYHQTIVFL